MCPSRLRPILALAPLLCAAATSCGATAEHLYAPEQATTWLDGYPATRTPVPPERPQGEVRVASFGVTELGAGDDVALTTLHVRLVVDNASDPAGWTLDTSEQLIEIPGEGKSRAVFVNSDVANLLAMTIGARDRRVLDFYFPLPATISDDDALPAFDFLWQVKTGERDVAQRVSFQRVTLEEADERHGEVVLVTGWGPHWWYNPAYPHVVFAHPPVIVVREPPHRVIIRRPPHRHYRPATRDHRR